MQVGPSLLCSIMILSSAQKTNPLYVQFVFCLCLLYIAHCSLWAASVCYVCVTCICSMLLKFAMCTHHALFMFCYIRCLLPIMCCSCLCMLLIVYYALLMFATTCLLTIVYCLRVAHICTLLTAHLCVLYVTHSFPMFDFVLLTLVHCSLLIMCGYVHNYNTLQLAMPQYI